MRIAVAFTGPSNSGKTTLIENIAKKLIDRYKILIIKNDPKDKAEFDREGKDSYKFFQTGAEVVITSPTRTTYFSHKKREIEDIIKMVDEFDLLFVEGLKTIPLPRIGVFRDKLDISYFDFIKSVAINSTIKRENIPKEIDILDLNNIDLIIDWIFKNGKRV